jgi:hypothetical protein
MRLRLQLRQLRNKIRERRSRSFTEIKLMMLMRFTRLGLRLLSHLTLLLGVATLLGCKGVQEVIIVGGRRKVMVLGGELNPYSPLYFWGIC